jgi:arsenate reductase (thioredoxin)
LGCSSVPDGGRGVLFVCEHGAAKSVLAAELLERAAEAHGVRVGASAAGIEPSEAVAEGVVGLLPERAWLLRARRPRRVTSDDVEAAAIVVTFNVDPDDLPGRPRELIAWDDVPPVSSDPAAARAVIDGHITELLARRRA